MKIKLKDPVRAKACVQWLIKEVGPQQPGTPGNILHGFGWCTRIHLDYYTGCMFEIEITNDVDEDTTMMFALRWAE
jgi:hypothetical protein